MTTFDLSPITRAHSQVLIFGESAHATRGFKYEIAALLRTLRNKGYRHFVMEMFSTDMNALLARYSSSGGGETELLAHLQANWRWVEQSPRHYFDLVTAARQAGMMLWGMDLPLADYIHTKDPWEHSRRNEHMVNTLRQVMARADGKLVVYTHILHGSHYVERRQDALYEHVGIKELLLKAGGGLQGANPLLVQLVGSPFCLGVDDCIEGNTKVEVDARRNGRAQQRFLVRRPYNFKDPDYLLHLPQLRYRP